VVEELIRDWVFYSESGGGVTFSGGEPLFQPDFLEDTLKLCKEEGLHTALDTCGSGLWEDLERQLPYLDLVLFDIKLLDDQQHKEFTGTSNQPIFENLQRLTKTKIPLRIRRPVIPGVNDSEEEIVRMGEYLQETNGVSRIDLLPYHALSADKYIRLGRTQDSNWKAPSQEDRERITNHLEGMGFEVGWGG
jgi:pyruvate formate lyase activating enzyme